MKIKKIGIISGEGYLPKQIILEIQKKQYSQHVQIFPIVLDIVRDVSFYQDFKYLVANVGQIGKIIAYFKGEGIDQIYIAGKIDRNVVKSLILDNLGSLFVKKYQDSFMGGDNRILSSIIDFLHSHKIEVISYKNILIDSYKFIFKKNKSINSLLKTDISIANDILDTISCFDIGQAIVLQKGSVIAIEGAEGTDNMIKRCAKYIFNEDAILVKKAKIGQNMKIDLPAIGSNTINNCHQVGIKNIVIGENVVVIDPQKTKQYLDDFDINIYKLANVLR